jgi:hypothetical protein
LKTNQHLFSRLSFNPPHPQFFLLVLVVNLLFLEQTHTSPISNFYSTFEELYQRTTNEKMAGNRLIILLTTMAVMAMIISQPAAVEASVSFFAFQKLINL